MKKVFVFTSLHNWDDVRIYQKEAKSLAQEYEIELHAVADFKYKKIGNIEVFGIKRIENRLFRPINCLKLLCLALKSDADIYHFHDPELLPIGVIIKKIKKKKVIYDAHENVRMTILNRDWVKDIFKKPLSRLWDLYEKRACRCLDLVITVLDEIASEFKEKNINVEVIKNYQIQNRQPKYNIMLGENINIVYAGSISEIRGILELVQSFRNINNDNLRLTLIGDFSSEKLKESVLKEIAKDKRIQYMGVLSFDESQKLVAQSDIGVVSYKKGPNHDYCLPNKIFEYMSVGVPIIATNIEYWRNKFEKYSNILFIDDVTSENISNAILYLIKNKEIAIEMGKQGYLAYKNCFTWEGEGKKLLRCYEKLLMN